MPTSDSCACGSWTPAWAIARAGAPRCAWPGSPSGGSASLAGRSHDHLVEADVRGAAERVEDRVGDVAGLQHRPDLLARALHRALDGRIAVVALQLGLDEARGDDRHPDAGVQR